MLGGSEVEVDGLSGEAVVNRERCPWRGEEGVIVSSETSRLWVWRLPAASGSNTPVRRFGEGGERGGDKDFNEEELSGASQE